MIITNFYNVFSYSPDGKLYFLDPEYHTWELKGSFEHILNDEDEEVCYELLDKQPTLYILRVSFSNSFSNIQYHYLNNSLTFFIEFV